MRFKYVRDNVVMKWRSWPALRTNCQSKNAVHEQESMLDDAVHKTSVDKQRKGT